MQLQKCRIKKIDIKFNKKYLHTSGLNRQLIIMLSSSGVMSKFSASIPLRKNHRKYYIIRKNK